MNQPVVLIVFACQSGDVEKNALSAAVGAVQARGMIRLRRLPDTEEFEPAEELLRMRKEYVAPAERDVLGADALILASAAAGESSLQWQGFLELLEKLSAEGKLHGKIAATIGGQFPSLARFGFAVSKSGSDSLVTGRDVVEKARSLRLSEELS